MQASKLKPVEAFRRWQNRKFSTNSKPEVLNNDKRLFKNSN
jgi:hypothetical protein